MVIIEARIKPNTRRRAAKTLPARGARARLHSVSFEGKKKEKEKETLENLISFIHHTLRVRRVAQLCFRTIFVREIEGRATRV